MSTAFSKSRGVLSVLLAALVGPLTASVLTVAMASPAHADTAPVGGTVAGGYVLGASDGGVYNFGAHDFGSMGGKPLAKPIVGMASTPTGDGYWMVASDGGIFSFGDAAFHGSTGHIALNKPIVGMASTPTGNGYWFVAEDGGIFAFGDAQFFGSTGAITLNKPIVGMAATPTGNGYWFVASDGGIFAFGDAAFKGSTGAITLAKPIVGMAAAPSGAGYWMVASDGGIFAFGDAGFFGSTGAITLAKPIVDMAATPSGEGYWLVAEDGGIFTFGNAAYRGSTGGMKLNGRIVDLLPQGGDITAPKLQSLSFSTRSVDTSTGEKTITVTARITDDIAGVWASQNDYTPGMTSSHFSPWISMQSPSGGQNVNATFSTRISGNHLDGIYQTTITIPAYSEQGLWTMTSHSGITLYDKAGNRTDLGSPTLTPAGYPTTFSQTGPGDVTAPKLQSLSFSTRSVDTSTGEKTITVTARITDDIAGVWASQNDYTPGMTSSHFSPWISMQSPSGGQNVNATFSTRISGNHLDGIYQTTITIPAYSEQGLWTMTSHSGITLYDKAGNRTDLGSPTLTPAGYPTTFSQTGPGDVTAPKLQSLSFSTRSVDTSTGEKTITVTARITDDIAGVWASQNDYTPGMTSSHFSPWISMQSPSGGQNVNATFSTRISGNHLDGIYQTTITIPAYSEQGLWTMTSHSGITLYDKAGNRTDLGSPTLTPAGYPTTFEVVRTD